MPPKRPPPQRCATRHTRAHQATGRPGNLLGTPADLPPMRRHRNPARAAPVVPPPPAQAQAPPVVPPLPQVYPPQPPAPNVPGPPANLLGALLGSHPVLNAVIANIGERDYANLRAVNRGLNQALPAYNPVDPDAGHPGHPAVFNLRRTCQSERFLDEVLVLRPGWTRNDPISHSHKWRAPNRNGARCTNDEADGHELRMCDGPAVGLNTLMPHPVNAQWVCRECVEGSYYTHNIPLNFPERIIPLCLPCSNAARQVHGYGCRCNNEFDDNTEHWLCLDCRIEEADHDFTTLVTRLSTRLPVLGLVPGLHARALENWVWTLGPDRNFCFCGRSWAQIVDHHWPFGFTQGLYWRRDFTSIYRFCLLCYGHVDLDDIIFRFPDVLI